MEILSQLSDVAIKQRLGSTDSRVENFQGRYTGHRHSLTQHASQFFSRTVLGVPTMVTSHPRVLCENAKAVNHLRGMRKGIFKRTANSETSFSIIKIKTEP